MKANYLSWGIIVRDGRDNYPSLQLPRPYSDERGRKASVVNKRRRPRSVGLRPPTTMTHGLARESLPRNWAVVALPSGR